MMEQDGSGLAYADILDLARRRRDDDARRQFEAAADESERTFAERSKRFAVSAAREMKAARDVMRRQYRDAAGEMDKQTEELKSLRQQIWGIAQAMLALTEEVPAAKAIGRLHSADASELEKFLELYRAQIGKWLDRGEKGRAEAQAAVMKLHRLIEDIKGMR